MGEMEDIARYIQGYLDHPETPEEIATAEATINYAFDEESWEDEFNKGLGEKSGGPSISR